MNKASIWPYDYLSSDYPIPSPDVATIRGADTEISFRCFIICPFTPNERADALRRVVEKICQEITESLQGILAGSTGTLGDDERISYTVNMFPWAGTIPSAGFARSPQPSAYSLQLLNERTEHPLDLDHVFRESLEILALQVFEFVCEEELVLDLRG